MLRYIKRRIKEQILKRLCSSHSLTREVLLWRSIGDHLGTSRGLRIVDVGAHSGSFVRALSSMTKIRHAILVEPQPAMIAALRPSFPPPQYTLIEAAVSNERGTSNFHILGWNESSSLHMPRSEVGGIGNLYDFSIKNTISVRTDTLDNLLDQFAAEGAIDIIKLDTQGAERAAIEGGQRVLPRTRVIICEVPLKVTYEAAATMSEISALVEKLGFVLIDLIPNTRAEKGELIECDAIFCNVRMP